MTFYDIMQATLPGVLCMVLPIGRIQAKMRSFRSIRKKVLSKVFSKLDKYGIMYLKATPHN